MVNSRQQQFETGRPNLLVCEKNDPTTLRFKADGLSQGGE